MRALHARPDVLAPFTSLADPSLFQPFQVLFVARVIRGYDRRFCVEFGAATFSITQVARYGRFEGGMRLERCCLGLLQEGYLARGWRHYELLALPPSHPLTVDLEEIKRRLAHLQSSHLPFQPPLLSCGLVIVPQPLNLLLFLLDPVSSDSVGCSSILHQYGLLRLGLLPHCPRVRIHLGGGRPLPC